MLYDKWVKEWKSALAENFFLRVLCLVLAVAMVINVVFFRKRDRIIIVPPKVEKEFWLEGDRVSDSYLEQMGMFFATFAGNMSPLSAEYNTKILSDYADAGAYTEIRNDIAAQGAYFRKNNITQAFFPESVKVDAEHRSVAVEGNAIRYVGTVKVSQERVVMNVRFKTRDYSLKIAELYVDYPERKKEKIEADEKAAAKKKLQEQQKEQQKKSKEEGR